jgi:hypothetical protein
MNRLLLLTLVTMVGMPPLAEDPHRIVAEAQKQSSVDSQQYAGLLEVTDARGKAARKAWTYERSGSHGSSKVVIRFTAPAEVKGVALLVVNHPDRSADQWMWTPALNRERRIATQDRRTRFFGTDFSFEDLEERDVEQYDYVLDGEEAIDGEPCWRIAATPRTGKRSQYTRSMFWIRKDTYTYARIENFEESKLVRRLTYRNLANIQGIWTARLLEMEDHARGSRTMLRLDSVTYNTPLAAERFTLAALRRG